MIENNNKNPVNTECEEPKEEIKTQKSVEEGLERIGKSELKYFSRIELLEVLLEYAKENEALKKEVVNLQGALDDKRIKIESFGSIAEASIGLNGVFEAAQASCMQFLENARLVCAQQTEESKIILENAQKKANEILEDARRKSENIEGEKAKLMAETIKKCDELKNETAEKCARTMQEVDRRCAKKIAETERQIDENWKLLSLRLDEFYKSHKGLMELVNQGIFNVSQRGSVNEN